MEQERRGFVYGLGKKKKERTTRGGLKGLKKIAGDSRAASARRRRLVKKGRGGAGGGWRLVPRRKEGEDKKREKGVVKDKKRLQFQSRPGDTVGSRQHKAGDPRRSERRATSEAAPIWRCDAY